MLIIAFTWLVNIPSHIFPCYLNTLTTPQICWVCCPSQPRLSGAYSATLTAPPCQIWVKHEVAAATCLYKHEVVAATCLYKHEVAAATCLYKHEVVVRKWCKGLFLQGSMCCVTGGTLLTLCCHKTSHYMPSPWEFCAFAFVVIMKICRCSFLVWFAPFCGKEGGGGGIIFF